MSRAMILALCCLIAAGAKANELKGRVKTAGMAGRTLLLLDTRGGMHAPVDSLLLDASGSFRFAFPHNVPGFFQLHMAEAGRVDLILDPQEPLVEVDLEGLPFQEHVLVRTSQQNQRLWEYKQLSRSALGARNLVGAAQAGTAEARVAEAEARAHESAKNLYLDKMLLEMPAAYFSKVIRADRRLDPLVGGSPLAVLEAFDLRDPDLLHSAVYDRALMIFLQNVNAVAPIQFMVATDSLMARAAGTTRAELHILDRLLELFTAYGPESAAQYVVDRYLQPMGLRQALPEALRERVERFSAVAVGSPVPVIALPDGKSTPLAEALDGAAHTLLFFYSSSCEHCHAEIPLLRTLYATNERSELAIIGIALDADTAEFEEGLRELDITWPTWCECVAWGSPLAKAFHIQSTPSLILMDRSGRIVAKPQDAVELQELLSKR